MKQTFEEACMEDRGRVLTGKYAHCCPDWDGLTIDETCGEWPCICKPIIDERIEDGSWARASAEASKS